MNKPITYIIKHDDAVVSINSNELARLALEIHGGGWNESETANAMEWMGRVQASAEPVLFKTPMGTVCTIEVGE